MILYALRHGEAEKSAVADVDRKLTAKGSEQIRSASERAKRLGANPEIIMSSPLVRARASAEIARSVLNPTAEVLVANCLEPEGNTDDVYAYLQKLTRSQSTLLVTHTPVLVKLVAEMTGCSRVELKTGSFVRIDSRGFPARDSGTLVWLLPQLV